MAGKTVLSGELVEVPHENGKANGTTTRDEEIYDCFASDRTRKIYLTPKMWVELKAELNYGEEQELNSILVRGYSKDDLESAAAEGRTITHVNSGAWALARMALYVDDWNLIDERGVTIRLPRKLEERVAVVRKLTPKVANLIQTEIARLRGEIPQGDTQPALSDGHDDEGLPDPLSGRPTA